MFVVITIICLIAVMEVLDNQSAVPEVRKRSTGIIGLNLLLEGGFPSGTLIMLHGTAVAGVDLAARQFCNADPEEEGTYIIPEEILENIDTDEELNPSIFLDRMSGTRAVIDSLSFIIEGYGIEQTLLLLNILKENIRQRQANLMFIVYSDVHSPMDMTRIMRIADIVIELSSQEQQAEIQRTLSVQKIRGAAVPQRLLPFIITDKGIEASTTSRVV